MNVKRGYVPIEIGGKELYLRLDFNALALADQRLGGSALQALSTGSFHAVQQVLLAGLQNPMNDRKDLKAARELDAGEFEYYIDCIMEALEASGVISSDEEAEGEPTAPTKRGKSKDPTTTIE